MVHKTIPALKINQPILVISRGCQGSTYVGAQLKHLLEGLGTKVYHGQWEACKTQKNPFYKAGKTMGEAMIEMAKAATDAGRQLVVKCNPEQLEDPELLSAFLAMKTNAVSFRRANLLDVFACRVRDCLDKGRTLGKPLNKDGTASRVCKTAFLKRRKAARANETIAYIDPMQLVGKLAASAQEVREEFESVLHHGLLKTSRDQFSYEELLNYEDDASELGRSAEEWVRLLAAVGVDADVAKVTAILLPNAGGFHFTSQNRSIFKYEDVKYALNGTWAEKFLHE